MNKEEIVKQIGVICRQDAASRFLWQSKIRQAVDEERVILRFDGKGKVIGFLLFIKYKKKNVINLYVMAVDKNHYGKGLCTSMLVDAINGFKDFKFIGEVRSDNKASIHIFTKLGFSRIREKDHYVGEDKNIKILRFER